MAPTLDSIGLESHVTVFKIVGGVLATCLVYRVCLLVYRVSFHPLAKFPGPKLYAVSYLPYLVNCKIRGRFAKEVLDLHKKYGPIVRISPDRLAIDGSIGWLDVFAPRGDRPEFDKTVEFYGLSERVGILPTFKEDHRRQRRLLSHAFSAASLQEQEGYIKYYVDLLISQLQSEEKQGRSVDMTKWYNYLTFDVIGELVFADPFHSLANGKYHPWVALIFDSIRSGSRMTFFNHYSFLRPLLSFVGGKEMIQKQSESYGLSVSKTEKRLQLGVAESRKDFMTYILRHNADGKGMTHEEVLRNSHTLIGAGSETTATALSGLTFYLATNPRVYKQLANEIRNSFSSEEEITLKSTSHLQYLHACLEEILRVYPPAAETPPRISPGDIVGGQYVPKGTLISIYQWATHHSPSNFADPDTFVPERWFPLSHPLYDAKYSSDNKMAFRPFSYGPRDCIGKNLAYSEMRLVMARLLWNFDFQLEPEQDDWAAKQRVFIVYEKSPLMLRLTPAVRKVEN